MIIYNKVEFSTSTFIIICKESEYTIMNNKVLFNNGWEFAKSSLEVTDCTDLKFDPVDIPHDWLIYIIH